MQNYNYKFFAKAILIILALTNINFAKTLSIQSLKSEANLKQGRIIFTGQVKMTLKDHFIKAEKVVVMNKNNVVKSLEVFQNIEALVKFDANNSYQIKAQKLTYKTKTKDFRFEGNVSIQDIQKSRLLKGNVVHLNEVNQSIYIDGSEQNPMQVIFNLNQ